MKKLSLIVIVDGAFIFFTAFLILYTFIKPLVKSIVSATIIVAILSAIITLIFIMYINQREEKKGNKILSEKSYSAFLKYLYLADNTTAVKSKAYLYCAVDDPHCSIVKMSHFFLQPFFVKRAYLLEQYHRIAGKSVFFGINVDVGGKFAFVGLAGYGGGDHCGTEFVAYIILYDKYRSDAALFRADNRAQIGVIYISSLYTHFWILPFSSFCFYFYLILIDYSVRKKMKMIF